MNTNLSKQAASIFTVLVMVFTMLGVPPLSAYAGAPGVCYVNASASGANTGASWADAYTDLQSALGAPSCTEIWVAAGTYKPTGGVDRAISFTLKNGVALYGGFAGTETLRRQRDWAVNVTTLSGDIGTADDATDNSYHVVRSGGGFGAAGILDGFTITAGNADSDDEGGGMDIYGGGMYNGSQDPILTNLIFSGNSAANYGGGMYSAFGNATLTNVTFSDNSAGVRGGGMFDYVGSSPVLTNVTFSGNSATNGGGMYNVYDSPTLTNVTFSSNSASYIGGGMYNDNGSPILTNVTFSGNSASWSGGGMYNLGSPISKMTNVTFSGNTALYGGELVSGGVSSLQIRDSIFWSNSASVDDSAEIDTDTYSSLSLADSVVAGGCPSGATCANLLTTDPQLGPLANNGGFTQTMALGAGSSAIDTGNDATCASTDQRGVARPQGAHCDMGAYEWLGHIISGNAGVAEAILSYTDGFPQTASTDLNGDYTLGVTQGWSGTVTPSKLGWSFTPDQQDYANILSDQTGQDYTATRYAYVIYGNAGLAGVRLSYTDGAVKTALADGSGNYAFTVSFNWSGTVTPSKTGFNYIFTPPSRSYTDLAADQTAQDFIPTIYWIYLPLVAR